jgi:alpha-tubulin suppressor-like RCC1 family protein
MNFTSYGVVAALALAWAGVPAFADPYTWGDNSSGQLGDGTYADRSLPGTVDLTGVLAGKTLTAISTRGSHCLALDSDGKVYAWGNNDHGQLGDYNPQ